MTNANIETKPRHSSQINPEDKPVHQTHALFSAERLINMMLGYEWQHECVIIPDYLPPYPDANTRPRCVVMHIGKDGDRSFLRHSAGPATGTFWDGYGDDFLYPELALVELAKAPPPPRVGLVIPTSGNAYRPRDAQD